MVLIKKEFFSLNLYYEFLVLCVDNSVDGWWNDILGNSTILTAPLGSECDFNPSDEYNNYGFTINLDFLNSGTYLVKILSGEKSYVEEIIYNK